MHANFQLSNLGEQLVLTNTDSLVNIELSQFNDLLASKANMRTKLHSGTTKDSDTVLYKIFPLKFCNHFR